MSGVPSVGSSSQAGYPPYTASLKELDDDYGRESDPLIGYTVHRHYHHPDAELEVGRSPTRSLSSEPAHSSIAGDDDDDDANEDDGWQTANEDVGHGMKGKREIGLTSAAFLIFNRVIGTGIFATPSVILRSSGSVGLSLLLWLLGAVVAACGTVVYIELGTALPYSGGEKNYLDYIFRRPRFLATCTYAAYAVFIGWQSASTSVFGEYIMHALNPTQTPSPFSTRLASLCCITFAFLLHGTHVNWGIRLQNALGLFKFFVLSGIAICGLAVLFGVKGFQIANPPNNFDWNTMWEGSASGGANAFVTGMYNVIWSFIGYSNANYALSEVRNPVRTLKRAAPLAMLLVTLVYMLVNVAYYAVVSTEEILGSGRIVAALFFGKVWGVGAERVLSAIVALSTLGNVLAVLFTHGRVIQELGREHILPFSSFFASNRPFDAPLAGLFAQYIVNALLVVAVPAGDAYLFMLNCKHQASLILKLSADPLSNITTGSSYPLSLINMFVSGGLLLLHLPPHAPLHRLAEMLKITYKWHPPFRAYTSAIAFFFISNVFLAFAPLIPPAHGFKVYERLPYWLHVFTGAAISGVGAAYWYVRCRWLPVRRGYRVVRRRVVQDDGVARRVLQKSCL
ncbi:hypothetical protein EIP86_008869 [Pleurotus ostreatoroseus]|nr:hypothetical protein EIP86_008869 [Pleurotus ostreatoroseus]